ncbi:hypothetical protein D9M70_633300 [compost metagenome]
MKYAMAFGVALGEQFGHPVFRVDGLHPESGCKNSVQFLADHFFSPAFHPPGFHHHEPV